MNKIERKFHESIPHNKLRLHSAERNTKFGKVFTEYKKSLKEEDIRFYPNVHELNKPHSIFIVKDMNNVHELNKPLEKFYGYSNFLMGFGSDRCINYFFEAHRKKHWFWGRKRLVISDPSFPMYDVYGQIHDYKIKKVKYNIIKFPISEFLDDIDSNCIIKSIFTNR